MQGPGVMNATVESYEQAVAGHSWRVPERFNIAADVCDRHPREKLAMIHEHFSGAIRQVSWGEIQDLSNRFANLLAQHGVRRGDRVAVVMPPTPETAAVFFATWKLGALLLSMSARASSSTAWASGRGRLVSARCWGRGGWGRSSAYTSGRRDLSRTSSSTSSLATA